MSMDFDAVRKMQGTTKEELERISAGILALATWDEGAKIDDKIPPFTWEQKIDNLVEIAKVVGTYLEVEIEDPESDGHLETRRKLNDLFGQFCWWRHEEPYLVDEMKAIKYELLAWAGLHRGKGIAEKCMPRFHEIIDKFGKNEE